MEADETPTTPPQEAVDGSLLGVLQEARTKVAREDTDTLVLPVPAYDDEKGESRIGIRFRYPEGGWDRIRNVGRQAENDPSPLAELHAYALQIATCTAEIVGLKGIDDDGEWITVPIVEGERHRFTKDFAERVGIEVDDEIRRPSVHIVRHFFSPRAQETGEFRGDVALTGTALVLAQFLEKGKASVARKFVGES